MKLEMFKEHLEKERNLSDHTVLNYVSDLNQFRQFVAPKVEQEVDSEDIVAFIKYLREQGYSVSSTNRKLSALKTYYKFLVRRGLVEHNPALPVEGGKMEQRLPKPVDELDIERMINATTNLRDRTLIELLYATGMRRFEVAKLRVSDINFRQSYTRVLGKGGKERIVPLYPDVLELVKQQAAHGQEWLFPGRNGHLSTRQINAIVKKVAERAGVANVTPHSLRHSFCSHLYDGGAELKVIQDLAGHASPTTTQGYTKINNVRNREEYMACHPRAKRTAI